MSDIKTHVLCVIYGTELYGSERGTLQALISLSESGVKVTVVGSGRKPNGGQAGEAIAKMGFPLHLIPFGSHLKRSWMLNNREYRKIIYRRIKRCSVMFRQIIKETQPTHIMLCGTTPLPFIILPILLSRVHIIYRMGDAPIISSKIHFPLWKWLVRRAVSIVSISDYMKSVVISHAPRTQNSTKIHVIHNISPNRIGNIDQKLTEQLKQTKRPFQLVYVGQLTAKKGVEILVKALIALDNPNVGCWLVGDFMGNKEFDKEIQKTLNEANTKTSIELLGYLEDPRPYYLTANWHIAPSIYQEPLGNVVQEAQLQATPSIVSNSGGLPELVEHEKTGWILESPTTECIKQTIGHLLKSPPWIFNTEAAIRAKNKAYGNTEFNAAWLNAIMQP